MWWWYWYVPARYMSTIILGRTWICSFCRRSALDSLVLFLSYFRTKCIKLGVMQCGISVCFICEASERTAIMFCVWERPLLPVLRVLGFLVCAKNITQSLRKHKWNLLFSSKRFTFGYFVRGSEQWQQLVCLNFLFWLCSLPWFLYWNHNVSEISFISVFRWRGYEEIPVLLSP
jgi:hypothetical protein